MKKKKWIYYSNCNKYFKTSRKIWTNFSCVVNSILPSKQIPRLFGSQPRIYVHVEWRRGAAALLLLASLQNSVSNRKTAEQILRISKSINKIYFPSVWAASSVHQNFLLARFFSTSAYLNSPVYQLINAHVKLALLETGFVIIFIFGQWVPVEVKLGTIRNDRGRVSNTDIPDYTRLPLLTNQPCFRLNSLCEKPHARALHFTSLTLPLSGCIYILNCHALSTIKDDTPRNFVY